jgi:hypothetical protein
MLECLGRFDKLAEDEDAKEGMRNKARLGFCHFCAPAGPTALLVSHQRGAMHGVAFAFNH